jgi:hypothetical protein
MHCHEYLKVQLQLLLNQLKSENWTRNCTVGGTQFIKNWGRDWRETLPTGFVSEQPVLVAALGHLVGHVDVDDVTLARALRAASCWCASGGAVGRFLSAPHDRGGRAIEITEEVAALFEDMAETVREVEAMLRNEAYCPQIMRLRGLLARLSATLECK